MNQLKVYVASSWRNHRQPYMVKLLRDKGFDVYDFRNPTPDDHGFHWSEIDRNWAGWNVGQYRDALSHPVADVGYAKDFEAMDAADACVLVLPCGRSAHLEAGWMAGQGKRVVIYLPDAIEPELMYKLAYRVTGSLTEVVDALMEIDREEVSA